MGGGPGRFGLDAIRKAWEPACVVGPEVVAAEELGSSALEFDAEPVVVWPASSCRASAESDIST